jgi:serine/threonine-protein kinase
MGSVWRARHLQLDTVLAVKFINLDQRATSGGRARFEREAKAAALLHGPNVVEVYDYGVDDGMPYLVMELLQGEDLSRRIARTRRLPILSVVSLIRQVSRALRRAHEAGIVHRDLKPGNIFLVERDEDEEPLVKVLDFGIARAPRLGLVGDKTKTGTLLGSPRYMSPEQARSPRNVDPRSDLWSVAVIAFRSLTGKLPFVADEVADLLVKICTEAAPPPSSFDPELGDFDRFFEKAFSRNPDERFQTARELARDFATAAGVPSAPSRHGAGTTWSRTFDRSKVLAAMDRGATDLVAIATIDPEVAAPAEPEVTAAPPRPSAVPSRGAQITVPEGRLRPYSHDQGTLTESPGSLDVAYRLPAPRPSGVRLWGSASLVALAGLVVGAGVALNLLSSPISAASPTAAPPGQAAPPLGETALPAATALAQIEVAAPAPPAPDVPPPLASSKVDPGRKPRPARPVPSVAPSASTPPRPPGRRSFTSGI